jgi:hypothetical protein
MAPTKALEAGPEPGAAVASAVAATAVVVGRAFALVVEFVAGAVALPAVFLCHWPSVEPASGGPGPVSAGVSGVLGPASPATFPAVAGISCPFSRSRCWVEQDVPQPEGR